MSCSGAGSVRLGVPTMSYTPQLRLAPCTRRHGVVPVAEAQDRDRGDVRARALATDQQPVAAELRGRRARAATPRRLRSRRARSGTSARAPCGTRGSRSRRCTPAPCASSWGRCCARLPIMNAPPWMARYTASTVVGHEQPERDVVPSGPGIGPLRRRVDQRLPEHAAGLHHRPHLREQVALGVEMLRELPRSAPRSRRSRRARRRRTRRAVGIDQRHRARIPHAADACVPVRARSRFPFGTEPAPVRARSRQRF